ncbi:carbohydrate ABC transporter membrane protein 2, CUT1 family [Rhizobiales bacterium GAS113]|nr:carbohydrate ABC transporter membrane protein 2, CUT1 family [Rhizobiales bacterium GAS113]SEC41257.1 carbohydrate ABC transporter membrane protein 2, CUT1 family [Rhizobiales bacterium GAS188]
MRISPATRWMLFLAVLAIALLINAPIILTILNSFQTTEQMLVSKSVLPASYTLANYGFLLARTAYLGFLGNTLLIALASTLLTLAAAAFAGYALSRYPSAPITAYSRILLGVQMFPVILALIPLFIIFKALGLINNPLSVILIYTVVHLPFATWMLRAFFDSIPRELEEAALVDGCSRMQAFGRIVLPLTGPGLAAVAIFATLFSYNEFFIASVFLRDEETMTIPVGVQMFMQQYATDWGSLMAAATLTMIPAFLFFMFVQKYMIQGNVAGGVKG